MLDNGALRGENALKWVKRHANPVDALPVEVVSEVLAQLVWLPVGWRLLKSVLYLVRDLLMS